MKGRRGPWSRHDILFIRQNYEKFTPDEIAKELNRDPAAVQRYMEQHGFIVETTKMAGEKSVIQDIRKTRHWPVLMQQFDEIELDLCVYHWNSILRQFKEDIVHTEEIQVIDFIKLEILANRLLMSEKQQKKYVEALQDSIREERKLPITQRNHELILSLEKQVANIYASIETISKENRELVKQKMAILDKMRATRADRVKYLENKTESIVQWIRELIDRPELRKALGLEMEKERLANVEEYKRLTDYYTYADGMVDQPILCADSLKDDHS